MATVFRARPMRASPEVSPAALPGLVSIADNPVCGQPVCSIVHSARDVGLRSAVWQPAGPACRGTVILLQGRGDFIEKYFETIAGLRRRGFAVATFDFRGQGGSSREVGDPGKGHVDHFSLYGQDLEAVMAAIVRPACPRPFYLLAHSMGGAVGLLALSQGLDVAGAVLSAPMVDLVPALRPPLARPLSIALGSMGLGQMGIPRPRWARPAKGLVGGETSILTSDTARLDRLFAVLRAEPGLGSAQPTIGWVKAAFAAMATFRRSSFRARLAGPVLAVAGGADAVTSTPATQALISALPHGRMLALPGCRHEILLERDPFRARFWSAFDSFVQGLQAA